MGCPPVRGDNPLASASRLSYVQVDKHGITILYHPGADPGFLERGLRCIKRGYYYYYYFIFVGIFKKNEANTSFFLNIPMKMK